MERFSFDVLGIFQIATSRVFVGSSATRRDVVRSQTLSMLMAAHGGSRPDTGHNLGTPPRDPLWLQRSTLASENWGGGTERQLSAGTNGNTAQDIGVPWFAGWLGGKSLMRVSLRSEPAAASGVAIVTAETRQRWPDRGAVELKSHHKACGKSNEVH
jgi:hypothetical protein